ncbi:carboxymuconolactone decarboxylase family protein [Natronosalvus halobius]|uniref:carboxymuconolactone decarboxylase family protein n=1 Tax=Natronosalvus halobius TaxID=2953746 RepID=UPI00209F38DC|nr:carboxymuconolactone decarboxylase family protein [Natronosalvus halobius]USZ71423.1 carboxymuconolactone decarboxylase family protein [Natronosalvus halobius]
MVTRLEPIEKPDGLKMRLIYWMMRRKFGKVMIPLKVVIARMPGSLGLIRKLQKFHKRIPLDPELKLMVRTLISENNGCGYCLDLGESEANRENLGMGKFNALAEYQTSPLFSDRERAALAYAEELTRHKNVSDATFEELRKHFNDREIVEITWLNAMQNFTNLVTIPLEIESDGLCAIAQSEIQMEHDERSPMQNARE